MRRRRDRGVERPGARRRYICRAHDAGQDRFGRQRRQMAARRARPARPLPGLRPSPIPDLRPARRPPHHPAGLGVDRAAARQQAAAHPIAMTNEYVPGLEGIVAAQTAISLVDGANGRLVYRGYVIADLAEEMSFEEVAHLLWYGKLPTRAELDALTLELASSRRLTPAATATLNALPKDTDPMDVLRSVVPVQGVADRL